MKGFKVTSDWEEGNIMDEMVLLTQEWLNETYKGKSGYNSIEENGKTGWKTMYALTRALQLELGITQTSDSFGPTTLRKLKELGPISTSTNSKKNIVKIIQGALYCKGYGPGGLTGTFGQGTKEAIAEMQLHMGLSKTDGVVTPKVFKASLPKGALSFLNNGMTAWWCWYVSGLSIISPVKTMRSGLDSLIVRMTVFKSSRVK